MKRHDLSKSEVRARSSKSKEKRRKKKHNVHFVISVFEKIFSIGTSCFLHHAAVILGKGTISNETHLIPRTTYLGSK